MLYHLFRHSYLYIQLHHELTLHLFNLIPLIIKLSKTFNSCRNFISNFNNLFESIFTKAKSFISSSFDIKSSIPSVNVRTNLLERFKDLIVELIKSSTAVILRFDFTNSIADKTTLSGR